MRIMVYCSLSWGFPYFGKLPKPDKPYIILASISFSMFFSI